MPLRLFCLLSCFLFLVLVLVFLETESHYVALANLQTRLAFEKSTCICFPSSGITTPEQALKDSSWSQEVSPSACFTACRLITVFESGNMSAGVWHEGNRRHFLSNLQIAEPSSVPSVSGCFLISYILCQYLLLFLLI